MMESPFKKSDFIPIFIVSELFFKVVICLKLELLCPSELPPCFLGKSISYIFSNVFSLFTNKSSRLFLSYDVNSVNLTLSFARLASLSKLSSNSLASALFSSNLPIFFFPIISAFNLLLITFLLTSSTQSTNRFSRSPFSMTSLTFLAFSFLS